VKAEARQLVSAMSFERQKRFGRNENNNDFEIQGRVATA
jgi:hypothetical protein